MSTTTRAAVIDEFGGPDVFRIADVTVGPLAPGQVRVRVAYSAVNPIDLGTREGRVLPAERASFPMVLGWDAEGVIEEVGPDVSGLDTDDYVLVCTRQPATQAGTHADLIVVDADHVARAPRGWTDGRAAALGLAGITAEQAVLALGLEPGGSLLIDNPLGFIGTLAVQIAKAQGLKVIGTTAREHADAAASLGLDHVLASSGPDRVADTTADRVRDLLGDGVDGALDLLGGDASRRAFAAVRDGGRYVTVLPEWWSGGGAYEAARGIEPIVVENNPNRRDLDALSRLAADGHLQVPIAAGFSLEEVGEAHEALAGSGVRGKLIIRH